VDHAYAVGNLTSVVAVRYSSDGSAEAFFSRNSGEYAPVQVYSEDLASVLLRFENGTKGCFSISQVFSGHKNDLEFEMNYKALSLKWGQEEQNEL
jgi:predicted dehydrogenase